jgi:hypothetical protein
MFFGLLQRTDILGRANPGLLEVHPAGMTPSLPVHAHHAVFSKKSVFNNKRACARKTFSRLFGSVQRSRRCSVGELLNRSCDPAPGVGATVITVRREFVDTGAALFERLVTLALQHQGGGTPNVDLGYQARKNRTLGVDKRLTPIIAWLAKLRVKVATAGAVDRHRQCRGVWHR